MAKECGINIIGEATFTNREHNFTIEQFKQIMTFDSDDGTIFEKQWVANQGGWN